jgi:hypothetical protein
MTETTDPSCVCGEPATPDTVHRTDGPCYVDGRRRTIANAIARVDAGKWGTEVPLQDHPFWLVYLAYADAVLEALDGIARIELRRMADEAQGAAEYSRALATPPSADAAAYIRQRMPSRMAGEAQQPETQQGPPRPPSPRCAHCRHPKRDHDGRADHRANSSPLVAGDPWCHACNAECDYAEQSATGAQQPETQADDGPPAPLRRSWDDCPGFPEKCPNIRPVDPDPPTHFGGIRCGCADEEPTS